MKFVDMLKTRAKALKAQLTAIWYAAQDRRIPLLPKIIILVAVGYALSPIDLIPDFIPVLGYLDDLLLLPALIGLAVKLIPAEIMEDAKKKAADEPVRLKKNRFVAVIFVLIWIAVLASIAAAVAKRLTA